MGKITVLEPVAQARPELKGLSPRPESLDGKRVAFLSNSKVNVAELFGLIEQRLGERFRLAGSVHQVKPSAPIPADEAVLNGLALDCDVGIVAIGD